MDHILVNVEANAGLVQGWLAASDWSAPMDAPGHRPL